jgi:hypothetical protein
MIQMIRKDPIHRFRDVAEWLQDWTYPSGIAQYIRENGKKSPELILLKGKLIIIPEKDPKEDVAVVLAALADHADMVDSTPAWQALDWIRSNAWYEPADMSFPDLIRSTDVLAIHNLKALQKEEVFLLDREISIRAFGDPKITFLLGKSRAPFSNVVETYGDRVMEI